MLKISKLADYATIIMHWLSVQGDHNFSATAIAEQVNIATPTVSKVLRLLNDAGLVIPVRGVYGGYRLSRPAEQVSVADIVAAIDGDLAMTECSYRDNQCQLQPRCKLSHNWQYISKAIYQFLDQLSLHDMSRPLEKSSLAPLQPYPIQPLNGKAYGKRK